MITPDEIKKKAARLYPSYMGIWVRGDDGDYFPRRVPANLVTDTEDWPASIRAVELLKSQSKDRRGWGYTVVEKNTKSPRKGHGPKPNKITIDTLDDLLRLAGKTNEFKHIKHVVDRLREEVPSLEPWIVRNVKSLTNYRDSLSGLIAVAKFFMANPLPGCYAKQVPVAVDTKFIGKHKAVLHQWLDLLLPESAKVPFETKFSRRFGLRELQTYRGVVVLDKQLSAEMGTPFDEFAAPARSLALLSVRDATVVVVENKVSQTDVPWLPRGLVVTGEGANANSLAEIPWMHTNRLLYWGDIDAAGFEILARLRLRVPHIESIMMNEATYLGYRSLASSGSGSQLQELSHLTKAERDMYERCVAEDVRLEQEKLPQEYVQQAFATALSEK